jgi:hypothetical protein
MIRLRQAYGATGSASAKPTARQVPPPPSLRRDRFLLRCATARQVPPPPSLRRYMLRIMNTDAGQTDERPTSILGLLHRWSLSVSFFCVPCVRARNRLGMRAGLSRLAPLSMA